MPFIILSFMLPGFGYVRLGHMRRFYALTILLYFIILCGSVFRLFPVFAGFVSISVLIICLHLGTALHAIIERSRLRCLPNQGSLKIIITGILLLGTFTAFGNSSVILGFDRVTMEVPVMEPGIEPGEQLLVDTWLYASERPQRWHIIIHRFAGQKGIYLNRVIGLPGEIIEIRNGAVLIDGKSLIEDF